ncbi:serine/threonine protein kinase [Thermoascus aurantiacus ATCC 26904]
MSSLLKLGQSLKGRASTYTITKQLYEFVWLTTSPDGQTVLIKSAQPADPPAIVLKYLDDDLLNASAARRLTTSDIKYVSKKVLEALKVLHEDGYDVKLDNVLLADLENTVHVESKVYKDRDLIGALFWRSSEAQLGLQWGPPTDVWSFGTMYHIYFGPYPLSYADLADEETLAILSYIMDIVPPEAMKPFSRASKQEISREDRVFVLKIMKLDPRDRQTAKELLEDKCS